MNDEEPLDLSPWAAPAPPRGLSGRVLDAIRRGGAPEPAELDTPPPDRPSDRPRRWAGVVGGLAVGLAAAAAVWGLWPRAPRVAASSGHVVAAAPSKISLAPGTTALLTSGADVRWQRDGATLAVTHSGGAATYEHTGPTRLVITTPGATVSTARATLHLEVPVNKHIVSGAAGAAVAAAAVIAVYEGRADVTQPGTAPRVVESGAQVAFTPTPVPAAPAFPTIARVTRDRAQRDALAAAIAGVRSSAATAAAPLPAGGGGGPGSAVAAVPPPASPVDATPGQLSKQEIRAGIKEVVPLMLDCYETMLEHNPTLRGTVTAKLVVDSEPDLGSIVTLKENLGMEMSMEGKPAIDELREFGECMTATLEAVVLPPLGDKDGERVEITYPFVFSPVGDGEPEPEPPPAPPARKPAPRRPPADDISGPPSSEPIAETAEELLTLSEEAAKRSQWGRALKYAEEAAAQPGPKAGTRARASMVASLAACNLRDAAKASQYFKLATPTSKTLIQQRCAAHKIDVDGDGQLLPAGSMVPVESKPPPPPASTEKIDR